MSERHVWTAQEETALEEQWGRVDPRTIARNMRVELSQVRSKAVRMRLGPVNRASGRLDANTIYRAIRGTGCYTDPVAWLRERGLRLTRTRNCSRALYTADAKTVWTWIEQHRSLVNWSRFPRGTIGMEPAWVEEERAARRGKRHSYAMWSAEERAQLQRELREDMTIEEIARAHGRTVQSIQHMAQKTGRLRPLPNTPRRWTREDNAALDQMAREGMDAEDIAARLERPVRSVGKKLEERARGKTPGQQRWEAALWTREDRMVAAGLARAGYDCREIAARMGRTEDAVRTKIRKLKRDPILGWE